MIAKFVVLLIGVQLASCQLRQGRQKLKIFQSPSCGKPCHTPMLDFWVGPCYDTPGCRIPNCCGMISGVASHFGMTYNATVPMKSGRFYGQLGGIGIGDTSSCNQIEIGLPTITIPSLLASFSRNICDSTQCPQEVGKTYSFDLDYTFSTSVLTTAFVNCHFVVRIESDDADEPALCYACHGRLVNSEFFPRLGKLLTDTIENPLSVVDNVIGAVADPKGVAVLPFLYYKNN